MAARRTATKVTTNHDAIRRWVEAKGGCPAHVKGTQRGGAPGVLRVDFPGYSGVETLEKISWDEWFKAFDKKKLAFVYQPSTRFSKLVARETAIAKTSTRATPRRATEAKRATAKRAATKRTGAKKGATRSPVKRSATSSRGTTKRSAGSKRGSTAKRATAKRAPKRAAGKRRSSR
ncbi:MAG TPA: hypothetical protein VM925_01645 [Labilithrix sp.]|jgi:hypothetical protein|nr:hypothetical protein [Labilithrix sp.]